MVFVMLDTKLVSSVQLRGARSEGRRSGTIAGEPPGINPGLAERSTYVAVSGLVD